MKPALFLLPSAATLSFTAASMLGFNDYIISCKNKNFQGACTFTSMMDLLDVCLDVPEPSTTKYGDKGSSFQVNGQIACRVFKTSALLDCKDPSVDTETGLTGKNGQRATGWFVQPGIVDWEGRFKFQSFLCTNLTGRTVDELPAVVVAECLDNDDVEYACRGSDAVPPGGE